MFSAKDERAGARTTRVVEARPTAVRRLLLALGMALTAVLATYSVARSISGDLLVHGRGGSTPVPGGAVAAATVAGGLAAWAIVGVAGRTRTPRATFVGLVVVGLALSSAVPVAAATTATTAAWLLLLHLVVAIPLVAVGWRLVPGAP